MDEKETKTVEEKRSLGVKEFKSRGDLTFDRRRPPLQTKGGAPSSSFGWGVREGTQEAWGLAGGNGYAQIFEAGAGAAFFFGAGIALDDFAEFLDAGGFLVEFDQGHAFLEVRGS